MDKIADSIVNETIANLEKQIKRERDARKLLIQQHAREIGWYQFGFLIAMLAGFFTLYVVGEAASRYQWCDEVARIYGQSK